LDSVSFIPQLLLSLSISISVFIAVVTISFTHLHHSIYYFFSAIVRIIMGGIPSKPTPPAGMNPGTAKRLRIVQNYLLVWVDANVSTSNDDSQRTMEHLRSIVNDVTVFTQPDECVTFLQGVQLEKVLLIVSGSIGCDLVPCIHAMTQIDTVYIFCGDKSRHEEWVKEWPKVKGVYTQIEPVSQALQLAVKQCDQNYTAISFASISTEGALKTNLNQLEPSFMYTQLFKNTLFTMKHDRKKALKDLVSYCQRAYAENPAQLALVNEFGRDYHPDQAIRWYTRQGFIYQMLNRSLRLLEADIIVNMGFFIHDLHQHIQQLYHKQVETYGGRPFLVYRGQGLSIVDFEKLQNSQGALMSFNCFLSTSTRKEIPIELARDTAIG
jgi:hypothetical protein